MKGKCFAMVGVLICAAAPVAAGQASARQTGQSSSFNKLDGFLRDGICSATVPAMGNSPARYSTGKFHGEKTLDGRWAVIYYDEDRTAANPKPFRVAQYIGYDSAAKHFVTVQFDNLSGTYATGVSSGWHGDTIVFDESILMDGKPAAARDVFATGEAGMSTHIGMLRDPSGKWITMDKETCHKP